MRITQVMNNLTSTLNDARCENASRGYAFHVPRYSNAKIRSEFYGTLRWQGQTKETIRRKREELEGQISILLAYAIGCALALVAMTAGMTIYDQGYWPAWAVVILVAFARAMFTKDPVEKGLLQAFCAIGIFIIAGNLTFLRRNDAADLICYTLGIAVPLGVATGTILRARALLKEAQYVKDEVLRSIPRLTDQPVELPKAKRNGTFWAKKPSLPRR